MRAMTGSMHDTVASRGTQNGIKFLTYVAVW